MADTPSRTSLYLDSSALVKLVVDERESEALATMVRDHRILSSELALTEVARSVRRAAAGGRTIRGEHRLERLLDKLGLVPLHRRQLMLAASFEEPWIDSLDAIHLAAALSSAATFDAFVTYDRKQARAAKYAGLNVLQPA